MYSEESIICLPLLSTKTDFIFNLSNFSINFTLSVHLNQFVFDYWIMDEYNCVYTMYVQHVHCRAIQLLCLAHITIN